MKTRTLFLILLLGLTGSTFSQGFYDINTINTIEITFEQSNWDYLLDQLVSAGNEDRLMGSVSINGQVFDSVGVRYKGNSSYRANQVKNPLNIKLDYIINNQEIEGYGTLKLANVYNDPSFVREALSYEIARKYMPASEANFAKVYVNGTQLGLYTSVQDVDKYFMRTHFTSDENARFKGELGNNVQPGQMGGVWEYFGNDSTDYYDLYAAESDFGWDELLEFLDTLNNHSNYVDEVLNIDRHLWFLAFSNMVVNLDGPINNPQNYYLFQDDAGRFNPIPWDFNESFGIFTMLQSSGPLNTYQLQHLSPFVNITSSDYPNIKNVLSNDTYYKMYVAHMKTIIEELFSNGWYKTRALEIQDIIDAYVQADPNKFYTYSNFIANINSAVGGGPFSKIGITQLMETRINYLLNLADFEDQQPVFSNVNYTPEQPETNSEIWFSAEVNYGSEVYLAYRSWSSQAFQTLEMFDDGNHNDGAAGDNVYGISVMPESTEMQYYFYAENNDAAAFMPVHAANEYYSMSIASSLGNLVINEFMADNASTVTDQDGEYDDWIELYNNGTTAISLTGYYLSDDASEPDLWSFPDTSITAGGYLIVWADKDEDQEGLHADLKLSKSGETILLSDASLSIVDEISFGQQITDTTFARFPNGTGEFTFMSPTFGAKNDTTSGQTTQTIQVPAGWSGISGFLVPDNPMVAEMFIELTDDGQLVILQNMDGVYWPEAELNTIDQNGGWDSKSGYMIKVVGGQEFSILGTPVTDLSLDFESAGWYLIPVLSECNVNIDNLFSEVIDQVDVLKEVAGTGVYWPGVVQTLQTLEPGKAYLIKLNGPASITFPDCR
ncbi:MAG: hypothetical protein EOM83_16900 [Clostridia bacterium]|nr:hypothetical protein [Clostridia bacterium]